MLHDTSCDDDDDEESDDDEVLRALRSTVMSFYVRDKFKHKLSASLLVEPEAQMQLTHTNFHFESFSRCIFHRCMKWKLLYGGSGEGGGELS